MKIPDIIEKYAEEEILIEVIADGYKLNDIGLCWRGYFYYKKNNEWIEEDCGCYLKWKDAFKSVVKTIKQNKISNENNS